LEKLDSRWTTDPLSDYYQLVHMLEKVKNPDVQGHTKRCLNHRRRGRTPAIGWECGTHANFYFVVEQLIVNK